MNGDIVPVIATSAGAVGFVAGEAVDWVASRHAARKPQQPANPAWEADADEDFIPLPQEIPEVPLSRYDRIRQRIDPWISGIAVSGAGVGLSLAMLVIPGAKAHEHIQPSVGLIVDNGGQTATPYGGAATGVPMSTTIDKYVKAFENTSAFNTHMFYTYQGQVIPGTANQILSAGIFGQADLGGGISNALTGNKAVFVLAGDSELSNTTSNANNDPSYLPNLVASANKLGERVFIMNAVPKGTNDTASSQMEEVTAGTDGQYLTFDQTSPQAFIKAEGTKFRPSQNEISTTVDSEKGEWAGMLALSLIGGAIGIAKRNKTVIGRSFKQAKQDKGSK